jgi:hypothetical protein
MLEWPAILYIQKTGHDAVNTAMTAQLQALVQTRQRAVRRLTNEIQRQKRLLLVEIRDRYKKEQPVIDSERQLSGKVVDEEVRSVLEWSENMTIEHLLLIEVVMTLPKTIPEKEP